MYISFCDKIRRNFLDLFSGITLAVIEESTLYSVLEACVEHLHNLAVELLFRWGLGKFVSFCICTENEATWRQNRAVIKDTKYVMETSDINQPFTRCINEIKQCMDSLARESCEITMDCEKMHVCCYEGMKSKTVLQILVGVTPTKIFF